MDRRTFLASAGIAAGAAALAKQTRAAETARFQGGLSYKEIAGALEITLENTKFRIHHGLKLLRALLVTR